MAWREHANRLALVLWDEGGWVLQAESGAVLQEGDENDRNAAACAAGVRLGQASFACRAPDGVVYDAEGY